MAETYVASAQRTTRVCCTRSVDSTETSEGVVMGPMILPVEVGPIQTHAPRRGLPRVRAWRELAARAFGATDEIVPAAMTTSAGRLALLVAGIPYPHADVAKAPPSAGRPAIE